MLEQSEITEKIVGAAIEVHRNLGPGLLESVYEECLCHELSAARLSFARQVELPVVYKEVRLDAGLRMDLVVEDAVVLELKSVETLLPVHEAQLLTYLRLSKHPVGLLINFNVPLLKDGIKRRVLTPGGQFSASSPRSPRTGIRLSTSPRPLRLRGEKDN